MKIKKECIPCLIKRIIFEAKECTSDEKVLDKVIRDMTKRFSEVYAHDECSAVVATKVHKAAYEALNDKDPYKNLKEESNKVALSLDGRVRELVKKSDDPLKMSILCSIVGNTLDFGIDGGSAHPSVLMDMFEDCISDGFGFDDTDAVKEYLSKSAHVLFFTDNCGEIVFDKIVCEEIKKLYPDMHLTLVVKGEPVLSDATLKDALDLGFDKIVDEIITTGCFAVGVDFDNLPFDLKKQLDDCDFIICKGMANYEVFSETSYHPIAYFLRTKCSPIAESMGLPLQINAVKLYP